MAADRPASPGVASSPGGELARPASLTSPTSPAAAFFDLDKTLMQGSSAFQFGRAAYRAGLLGRRQLLADAVANLQFRLRGATDADSVALRERIAASLEGTRVVDLERLGANVLALILPRVYPQMLALAHEHQDAGRRAYIVTAASQELADILAQVMALDGGIGSQISEVRDGVFTGKPTGVFVYRTGKAQAIQQLAARDGIDLEASFAYSDSESDLPMLEAVGHPVAVNPDLALLRIARDRGWDVLRFDRLGRRLKTAAALGAAAGAGGIGSMVVARRWRPNGAAVAVRRVRRGRQRGLSSALQR
ncbi:MAG TPA: HAD family hydrolase [Solirubrobacteraceae bacterium]|jgi:HAD superfamily hydrolase (TIGR01490 family)|nr:HAD family hydrolase [Solirubrobacteraceae bacterium]